jgi:uncharacterized membrane protein YfcA
VTDIADPPRANTVVALVGGVVAGFAAGMFGVGGGVLLVPFLVLLLKQPQHVAHATSLVAIVLAALSGVSRFGADGSVAVVGAIALAVGAVAGARLGATFLPKLTESRLRGLFGAVMLLIAVRFLIAGDTSGTGDTLPDMTAFLIALHVLGGLAAGISSAVLGVGGGVILVPLMVMGFGYGQHIAEGTSLAVIVPTAITGAIAHHKNRYTNWRLGVTIGAGSLLGGAAGAHVALGLDPSTLARLFGGLLLITAALMLYEKKDKAEVAA